MKTIKLEITHKKSIDSLGDLGNGYIIQRGNLFYGIWVTCKCIHLPERILFVTQFGDKLRKDYPNTSIRKFDDDRNPKRVKQLIEDYITN